MDVSIFLKEYGANTSMRATDISRVWREDIALCERQICATFGRPLNSATVRVTWKDTDGLAIEHEDELDEVDEEEEHLTGKYLCCWECLDHDVGWVPGEVIKRELINEA